MEPITGLPGVKTTRTATPRNLTITVDGRVLLPRGRIIDGAESRDPLNTGDLDVLRAGIVMGMITASGKYAPAIIGVLAGAYDKDGSDKTSMTVAAAVAVEIVRRIGTTGTFKITGPPTVAGTVVNETITDPIKFFTEMGDMQDPEFGATPMEKLVLERVAKKKAAQEAAEEAVEEA